MGFTIISEAVEWLGTKWEEHCTKVEEKKQRQKELEDELEKKRLEGTKVTVESFLFWKSKFDEERLAAKLKKEESETQDKLTGKQMFLENVSMNVSDVKFLDQESSEAVEVDEALFDEDLDDLVDDLDLEDSDDDDKR